MESIDIIIKAVNKAKGTLNELKGDLSGVGKEAGKLDKDSSKKAVSGLKLWRNELEKTKKSVKTLRDASQSIVDVSKKFLMAGAAMAGAAFFPIKQAGDFEVAMAKVKAIMTNVSEDTFERMKTQARSLGETTRYTATQSAEAFTFLAMAGLNAAEAMEALPGTLQLATAGGLDLAVAADLATNVLSGLGFEVNELTRVNDVLARTASRANTSVWELGEAMKIAGPAAKGSKEAFEDVAAVLGGLADAGIKGGEAGNAVKRMLILLQNPTKAAQIELSKLNVPLKDSEGRFRGLIPILRDLSTAQMDLSSSAKIFGMYSGTAAVAASGAAKKMGGLADELRNAKGSAEEMARVMSDTMFGAATLLKSAIGSLTLSITGPLMGVFKDALKAMANAVSMITTIVKALGPVVPMVVGLAVVLTGLIFTIGTLGMAIGGVTYGFAQWQIAIKMLAPTLTLIRGAVTASIANMTSLAGVMGVLKGAALALGRVLIAHPIMAIGTAVVSLYLYISQLTPKWEQLNEQAEKLRKESDKIESTFKRLYSQFVNTTEGTKAQTKAAIKLKDGLIELAKENSNISDAALKAADSIDRATGRIIDSGKALAEFDLAIIKNQFEAMAAEATAASAKMETAMKKMDIPTGPLDRLVRGFHDLNSLFFSFIPGIDTATKRYKDMGKQALKAAQEGKSFAESQVRELIKMNQIDPSLGLRQFQTYIKTLGPMSKQMTSFYFDAFLKIKIAQAEAAQSGTNVVRRSIEEQNVLLRSQADERGKILQDVKRAYEEAYEASAADPSNIAAINALNEAYRRSVKEVDKYVKAIEALRDNEIAIAQQTATEKIRIIEDEVRRGVLAKEQGELEKIRIVAEGAREEARILTEAAELIIEKVGRGSEVYTKMSAVAKKAAMDSYTAQAEALDKYEQKLRQTYEKASEEVRKYAKEVIEWNKKIAELSMSTEDKIRNVKRKTMTEYEQWQDKSMEAEEKMSAARQALEEGNFALSEKLAKQAESLYSELATKVVEGTGDQKQVFVTIEEGTRAAIGGYEAVKDVLTDVYGAQKDIAEETKTRWEDTIDTIKTTLEEISDKKVDINIRLAGIIDAEREIADLTRPETKTITIVTKEAKRFGGAIAKLASGGSLSGYGGGDKVNALLEAGEYVIRKEAVRKYGTWFFDMWNSMKLKASDMGSAVTNRLSNLQPQNPSIGYQAGGLASALPDMGRVELVVGSSAYPVIADIDVISKLKKAVEKENLIRAN